jgi:hypothetical protein
MFLWQNGLRGRASPRTAERLGAVEEGDVGPVVRVH